MKNRVPSPGQAGRVLVTPEDGGSPFYATIAMADNPTENGTPWSMESVLQDATAALFGLGADAVPDDLFAYLGKYNQHWWKRRKPENNYYTAVEELTTKDFFAVSWQTSLMSTYSDSYSVNEKTGEITLTNPTSEVLQANSQTANALNIINTKLKGKYFKTNGADTSVYKINETLVTGDITLDTDWYVKAGKGFILTSKLVTVPAGDWEYLQSSSRSAYPDSGQQGGYEYEYLGIPFDNAVKTPKIETGSYTGTGTYGSSNPNSLTFGFVPKFVLIQTNGLTLEITMLLNGITATGNNTGSGSSNNQVKPTWSNNTVSWYVDGNADDQRNISGKTYYYIAIG